MDGYISIHALLAESDYAIISVLSRAHKFLSTLSLRRATAGKHAQPPRQPNFYPRSPCGERHSFLSMGLDGRFISIHALLAESDPRA